MGMPSERRASPAVRWSARTSELLCELSLLSIWRTKLRLTTLSPLLPQSLGHVSVPDWVGRTSFRVQAAERVDGFGRPCELDPYVAGSPRTIVDSPTPRVDTLLINNLDPDALLS